MCRGKLCLVDKKTSPFETWLTTLQYVVRTLTGHGFYVNLSRDEYCFEELCGKDFLATGQCAWSGGGSHHRLVASRSYGDRAVRWSQATWINLSRGLVLGALIYQHVCRAVRRRCAADHSAGSPPAKPVLCDLWPWGVHSPLAITSLIIALLGLL